jgi:hypothetical protein
MPTALGGHVLVSARCPPAPSADLLIVDRLSIPMPILLRDMGMPPVAERKGVRFVDCFGSGLEADEVRKDPTAFLTIGLIVLRRALSKSVEILITWASLTGSG